MVAATKTTPARQRKPKEDAEPLIPDPVIAEEPRLVNGLAVLADVPAPSPLTVKAGQPQVTFKSLRLLTLADGSHVFGCGDCGGFTGSRGEVQKHRYDAHDAPRPGRRAIEAAIPSELSEMTIGELWELRAEAASWGHMLTELEVKLDEWRTRALAAEAWKKKVAAKFAGVGFTLNEDGD